MTAVITGAASGPGNNTRTGTGNGIRSYTQFFQQPDYAKMGKASYAPPERTYRIFLLLLLLSYQKENRLNYPIK
jgi:hypothetical protein